MVFLKSPPRSFEAVCVWQCETVGNDTDFCTLRVFSPFFVLCLTLLITQHREVILLLSKQATGPPRKRCTITGCQKVNTSQHSLSWDNNFTLCSELVIQPSKDLIQNVPRTVCPHRQALLHKESKLQSTLYRKVCSHFDRAFTSAYASVRRRD